MIGSRGYVARHLVESQTGEKKPEYAKLSCYFNLDYGAGRIRGIYLQGRTELKPIIESWLSSLNEGRLIASPRVTLGSDQATFEGIGLPGLSFVQDPLNYEVRAHHTNMDLPDYVSVEDLKRSVDVLAQVLYRAAICEEPLPRSTR